jgi:hypothetical protein
MTEEPLGLPTGSVRALMSLVVVIGAAVVAAFLTVRDPSSDLTKILVGGWGTALGNVIRLLLRRAVYGELVAVIRSEVRVRLTFVLGDTREATDATAAV